MYSKKNRHFFTKMLILIYCTSKNYNIKIKKKTEFNVELNNEQYFLFCLCKYKTKHHKSAIVFGIFKTTILHVALKSYEP